MTVSRLVRAVLLLALVGVGSAFVVERSFASQTQRSAIESNRPSIEHDASDSMQRRDAFKMVGLVIFSGGILNAVMPPAWASGGATAGKYT
jgi:hypothetical protein